MVKITPTKVQVFSAAAALAALLCAPGMAHASTVDSQSTAKLQSEYDALEQAADQAYSTWQSDVAATASAQQAYDDCSANPANNCDAQAANVEAKQNQEDADYNTWQQDEQAASDIGLLVYALQ